VVIAEAEPADQGLFRALLTNSEKRFSKVAPTIYRSLDFIEPAHLEPESWFAWQSPAKSSRDFRLT
jgi:hypothetical protein